MEALQNNSKGPDEFKGVSAVPAKIMYAIFVGTGAPCKWFTCVSPWAIGAGSTE